MVPTKSQFRLYYFLLSAVLSIQAFFSAPCVAQMSTPEPQKVLFKPSIDLALSVAGDLTEARTPLTRSSLASSYVTQKTQALDASAGVLATFHQAIKPWLGYTVNAAYTRSTHDYSYAQGFIPNPNAPGEAQYSQGSIKADRYELTLGYAVEGPRTQRFRSFAQVGGGGLFFVPTAYYYANQQTRLALLFGVGMDYAVTPRFAIRAEYRGLFYKGPDFAYDFGNVPVQRLFTITSSPTVGIVYRFGHHETCRCVNTR